MRDGCRTSTSAGHRPASDIDGNIAAFATGEMPLRDDLQNLERPDGAPPFLIRNGSGTRRHEWLPATSLQPNQALPYQLLRVDETPAAVNPARGYLATNNDPIGNTLATPRGNDRRAGGGANFHLTEPYTRHFGWAHRPPDPGEHHAGEPSISRPARLATGNRAARCRTFPPATLRASEQEHARTHGDRWPD